MRGFVLPGTVLLVAASLGAPAFASAQEASVDLTARASIAGVPVSDLAPPPSPAESPELRALREAERSLFPDPTALPERMEPPPARMSTTAGHRLDPPETRRATGPLRLPDAAFLRTLDMPDLPVRWDERMLRYLAFFRDDPRGRELMGAWLRRSGRHAQMVRRVLRELRAPEDLYYVAMIESGFDPRATSGAGAVGIWQLTSDSASAYGLAQSHWADQRRDPERSTRAAVTYLMDLRRRFGSWELALAAYNMGYVALLRSIRRFGTNDYWELARIEAGLPWETTFYVSKVAACAIIARNAARFGFTAPPDEPLRLASVRVPAGTPLAEVARAAGLDLDELRALNPELLRSRVPPVATPSLRIPAERRERAVPMLERLPASWEPYDVRLGESLDRIARLRGTTPSRLAELNDLAADAHVRPGTTLLVPVRDRDDTHAQPEDEPIVATVPDQRFDSGDRRRVFYRVAPGDALLDLARFFGARIEDVCRWNRLDPRALLQPGQVLQLFVPQSADLSRALVYTPAQVRVLAAGSAEFYAHRGGEEGRVRLVHHVEEGETMQSLARRYRLSVGSLSRINGIPPDATLGAGQSIVVYTTVPPPPSRSASPGPPRSRSAAPSRIPSGPPAHP